MRRKKCDLQSKTLSSNIFSTFGVGWQLFFYFPKLSMWQILPLYPMNRNQVRRQEGIDCFHLCLSLFVRTVKCYNTDGLKEDICCPFFVACLDTFRWLDTLNFEHIWNTVNMNNFNPAFYVTSHQYTCFSYKLSRTLSHICEMHLIVFCEFYNSWSSTLSGQERLTAND